MTAFLVGSDTPEQPAWHGDAACREHDSALWFPELGQTSSRAKAICRSCLVREECLGWALLHDVVGVWGATTSRQRRALRARRAA